MFKNSYKWLKTNHREKRYLFLKKDSIYLSLFILSIFLFNTYLSFRNFPLLHIQADTKEFGQINK